MAAQGAVTLWGPLASLVWRVWDMVQRLWLVCVCGVGGAAETIEMGGGSPGQGERALGHQANRRGSRL